MDASAKAYSRQVPLDRRLRASDRDREAVGEVLRQAHAAGRIDTDEFAERFGRCLEAKTYADLDQLISDLPANEEVALGTPDGRWRPPAWPAATEPPGTGGQAPWVPPGWVPPPWGPGREGPRQRHPFELWPVAAFIFMWAVLAVAVLAATGGHLFWLFFPVAWIFWLRQSGRRRSRWRSTDGTAPGSGRRTWEH